MARELPDIISSLVSLVCLTLFLKRWQPVRIFRFGDLGASQGGYDAGPHTLHGGTSDPRLVAVPVPDRHRDPVERAAIQALFAPGGAMYDFVINISVPFLDKMVARMPPVVSAATPYAAVYKFDWLSATGTAILFRRPAVHRLAAHEAERCADHLRRDAEGSGAADLLYRHGAGVRLYL
ncbi:L-lactate permease [Klebsiella pneumoniae subsp. pneumoniae]|nr:L-lactate permease [Klebsiella pneumoniae subsp. pneumoniae]